MSRAWSISVLLLLAVLPAVGPGVQAHHGWSGYDASRVMTLTGVIRESGYEHPHGHMRFEAPGKTWTVVLAPPSRMERRGLAKGMLAVGTTATVVGYPSHTVADEMRAERITIGDKTTELR
jgi:hypothetical protein